MEAVGAAAEVFIPSTRNAKLEALLAVGSNGTGIVVTHPLPMSVLSL
jgi:hypothetical protein